MPGTFLVAPSADSLWTLLLFSRATVKRKGLFRLPSLEVDSLVLTLMAWIRAPGILTFFHKVPWLLLFIVRNVLLDQFYPYFSYTRVIQYLFVWLGVRQSLSSHLINVPYSANCQPCTYFGRKSCYQKRMRLTKNVHNIQDIQILVLEKLYIGQKRTKIDSSWRCTHVFIPT